MMENIKSKIGYLLQLIGIVGMLTILFTTSDPLFGVLSSTGIMFLIFFWMIALGAGW